MARNDDILKIAHALGYPEKGMVTRGDVAKFYDIEDETAYRKLRKWNIDRYEKKYYLTWDVATAIYASRIECE